MIKAAVFETRIFHLWVQNVTVSANIFLGTKIHVHFNSKLARWQPYWKAPIQT